MRYTYSYGYRSHEAALNALHDLCACGELTIGEGPEISSYRTNKRELRWRITLPDNNLWHVA